MRWTLQIQKEQFQTMSNIVERRSVVATIFNSDCKTIKARLYNVINYMILYVILYVCNYIYLIWISMISCPQPICCFENGHSTFSCLAAARLSDQCNRSHTSKIVKEQFFYAGSLLEFDWYIRTFDKGLIILCEQDSNSQVCTYWHQWHLVQLRLLRSTYLLH